jgi:hypothetical protein
MRCPVVWPSGTSVAGADPLVIELPSGDRLELGDEVLGAGGYLSAEDLEVDVPDSCLNEQGEVAVFNPGRRPSPRPQLTHSATGSALPPVATVWATRPRGNPPPVAPT